MHTIYEANNSIEAHMLLDLLEQRGIKAFLVGDYLQTGFGELPSIAIQIQVLEADAEAASIVIQEWEKQSPTNTTKYNQTTTLNLGLIVLSICVGLALGFLVTHLLYTSNSHETELDHNLDGKPDEFISYSMNGSVLEVKVDRNFDGMIDFISQYNTSGEIESSSTDDDFNSSFETKYSYKFGNIVQSETNTDNDTIPNYKTYYKYGVPTETHFINPYTGFPFRIDHYRLGLLMHSDFDTNNDSIMDERRSYSDRIDLIKIEKISTPLQ
jgi:hypothetical protein